MSGPLPPLLDRRVAAVTGAAGGIGAAIARTFAAHGAAVALLDVDAPGLERLRAELEGAGATVRAVACDVRSEPGVEAALDDITGTLGAMDVLVNCAGVNAYFEPCTLTSEDWDAFFALNLKSAWLVSKHALPNMLERAGGAIINVSSLHARETVRGMFPYAAAKAGLEGLTRSLALEVGPAGVRVNALAPGFTRTRLTEEWLSRHPHPAGKERAVLDQHPLRRMATPQEVADCALFLASPLASAVTGTVLTVDCGLGACLPGGET